MDKWKEWWGENKAKGQSDNKKGRAVGAAHSMRLKCNVPGKNQAKCTYSRIKTRKLQTLSLSPPFWSPLIQPSDSRNGAAYITLRLKCHTHERVYKNTIGTYTPVYYHKLKKAGAISVVQTPMPSLRQSQCIFHFLNSLLAIILHNKRPCHQMWNP